MKSILQKTGLLLILLIGISSANAQAKKKADKATMAWRYEIEVVQTGTQGNYLIKVWSFSKKANIAIEQSKKNAVHGIIFKGFAGTQTVPGQKALLTENLEEDEAEYFKDFFADGGKYMKFVTLSTDGAVAAEDVMKVGKEYKVGVIISVNVSGLRKQLENDGKLKRLDAGF